MHNFLLLLFSRLVIVIFDVFGPKYRMISKQMAQGKG